MSISDLAARRRELGAFLRSRRERITPSEAGVPATGRRRTPGLRREELAFLAGISATWYTYLEQGRDIRPSEQVLTALATALRLTGHERDHLFHLAGAPAAPEPDEPEAVDPAVAAIPMLVRPNPAYLTGVSYDLLSVNPAATELFADLNTDRPNLARWMFTSPAARQVLVDWEREAQVLLARLRGAAGRHPAHPRFARLIEELHAASPEVREWWPRYDIQVSRTGTKRLRHPRHGIVTMTHTAFHVAEHPEQTLVVYAEQQD
ncbi:helix-turn-helix transcriptional regulator [Amycolatopsis minnesotensis]|uniref:Helix-turn-helix transcriptional regulator n=1 Tax=Amycolatopsis minnesotensis TaxID=337894 RepID=A0ABP5BX18_9PSEU